MFYAVGQQFTAGNSVAVVLSAYDSNSLALIGSLNFAPRYWPNESDQVVVTVSTGSSSGQSTQHAANLTITITD